MPQSRLLLFQGLDAAVALDVDQRFLDALPAVFLNWPSELEENSDLPVFLNICFESRKYTISSPFMDGPIAYDDPVNAICSMIVELAWAHLRADPSLLCLHGAAVEINGRLVVFPNARRAGKSTISVAMQAAGFRLFTDDFLPLSLDHNRHICGVSHGIAPRLRLPVPDQIGEQGRTYIENRSYIANRQYKYVSPAPGELAKFGDTLAVGALVFLERKDGVSPSFERLTQGEVLKSLLTQNFSRAMNSAGILEILGVMSASIPAYRMQYSEAEPAIAQLIEETGFWGETPAQVGAEQTRIFEEALEFRDTPALENWQMAVLEQADGVKEVATENKRFLSDPTGRNIHYLNAGATNIWRILENPASMAEIVELLTLAFPDHPADDIEKDVVATLGSFVKNGLLKHAPVGNVENHTQMEQVEAFGN